MAQPKNFVVFFKLQISPETSPSPVTTRVSKKIANAVSLNIRQNAVDILLYPAYVTDSRRCSEVLRVCIVPVLPPRAASRHGHSGYAAARLNALVLCA